MSDLPRQIRLAAGDYFMHGQDCRMRQVGLPGNVCCAVIKLDKGFDVERLRRRIAESPIMNWLARARIYIGNDSGITHLAAAVGTPVLALYGPASDPTVWAPRGEHVRVGRW